ncbi:putative 2-aminoethylphosphonate ABC transporter ATP-binding protein [Atopomonas sediminilitoris]|uniref:putative 2-aminoethylphosphonate ABC transporter ATP-binding protein n=1 Tax=Atopomonas sediminilitoris TaxID=2919919 RepID=UPI001F4EB62B|nr:putative 2-aminoethylphosphonate ABC transporter ATP-binding protein [Atopomonas sediminilitoris]MCJ8170528.1 putative 2-aminoethylphosphonate ABC transporter ATP-binding protein [Atopomonas sediminilitoris]
MHAHGLSLANINKHFGHFHALRDIDLQINAGELVCFLGPSGCGKTTLLRIIAGLEQQDRGSITQNGRDISALPPRERDFGIVFQSYALFPNLSVFDNVAFGLRSLKWAKAAIKTRVMSLLDLIGLADQARKYPNQLSGGQQQRVALARAMAPEPGLLLLDEPLSALDARVRQHLRREIRSLQQQLGVTTILVTHDQEEALTMADRVVVMNHGVIEQVGSPLEIYQQPASAFVADFVGAMNFVDSTLTSTQQAQVGEQLFNLPSPAGQQGSALRLAIRPEEVELCSRSGDSLPVVVEQLDFLGTYIRSHVHVPSLNQRLIVDIDPRSARALNLALGQHLGMRLPANALRCFAA